MTGAATAGVVNILPIFPLPVKRSMSTQAEKNDTESTEATPKRARFEMPSFKDLDLQKLSLKDNGLNRQGNAKLVLPLYGGNKLCFNLTPAGFLKTPFGFDTSCKYEKPSFLMGNFAGKSESLSLVLQLGEEEAEFFKNVNEFYKQKFAELDKKPHWHDLVNFTDKYGPVGKVKVVLDGENQTQIKIAGEDKSIRTGYGWTFLKPYLDENRNFRGCRCKVSVKLTSLWCKLGKAGLMLTATHLVLAAPEKEEGWGDCEVFEDEALLAEL